MQPTQQIQNTTCISTLSRQMFSDPVAQDFDSTSIGTRSGTLELKRPNWSLRGSSSAETEPRWTTTRMQLLENFKRKNMLWTLRLHGHMPCDVSPWHSCAGHDLPDHHCPLLIRTKSRWWIRSQRHIELDKILYLCRYMLAILRCETHGVLIEACSAWSARWWGAERPRQPRNG